VFRRSAASAAAEAPDAERTVEILVFELRDRDRIGYESIPGVLHLCCNEDLVQEGVCSEPNRVIVRRRGAVAAAGTAGDSSGTGGDGGGDTNDDGNNGGQNVDPRVLLDTPWVSRVSFSGAAVEAYPGETMWWAGRKGMYYLWFLSCDKDHLGSLEVHGHTQWKNPRGFLPGMMYPFLPFYTLLCMFLLALSGAWFYSAAQRWRELFPLQFLLTGTRNETAVNICLYLSPSCM
jgi:hypothetical protein